jgi:hypothetical protein
MERRGFFKNLGAIFGLSLIAPIDFLKSLESRENEWYHSSKVLDINFTLTYDDKKGLIQAYYKWPRPNGSIQHIYHDIKLESGLDINDPSVKRVMKKKISKRRKWVLDQYKMSLKESKSEGFRFMRIKGEGLEEEDW